MTPIFKDISVSNFYKFDITDAKPDELKKGRALLVDMEISSSGRVTNGRIYPPRGHQRGIASWTMPYQKPVLLHHDEHQDPIGRYVAARWESLDDKALKFLGGDYAALAKIKRAYDVGNPIQIRDTMNEFGAFDKAWPGLGRVIGTLRITDQDAIEKFTDGRYLTGSAGQQSDSFICMTCGAEWHNGNICEHQLGGMDEDGNPTYFLCGVMSGREYSLVNVPANDTSTTITMRFEDSTKGDLIASAVIDDLLSEAPTIKPTITWENEMNFDDLKVLDMKALLALLSDTNRVKEFTDALAGDSQYEVTWLIRIHDALHREWDYMLKYPESDSPLPMPTGVFQLHAAIHDISEDKDFRDSMMNGVLDDYSATGEQTGEYMVKVSSEDSAKDAKYLTLMDSMDSLITLMKEKVKPIEEPTNANDEEVQEAQAPEVLTPEPQAPEVTPADTETDTPDFVDDTEIDWELLDLALTALIPEDAKLSTEKRQGLKSSSFCGPDRSFPVPDCAHVTAARRLIGRAKLSADQKSRVLACVARKAKALGCDGDSEAADAECDCSKYSDLETKHQDLTKDYTQLLVQTDHYKTLLATTLIAIHKFANPVDSSIPKLDTLIDSYANADLITKLDGLKAVKPLKPTDNPSVVSTNPVAATTKLTRFENDVVAKYQSILNTKDGGKARADAWLAGQRPYLNPDFNIQKHVSQGVN